MSFSLSSLNSKTERPLCIVKLSSRKPFPKVYFGNSPKASSLVISLAEAPFHLQPRR